MSKAERLRNFIVKALSENDEMSTKELTKLATENSVISSGRDSSFRGAISKLHRDGVIIKRGRGSYQLYNGGRVERTSQKDFKQALNTVKNCIKELDDFNWKIEPLSEFCEAQDRVQALKELYEIIRVFLDDSQGRRIEHKDEIAMMAGLYQLRDEMEKENRRKEREQLISKMEESGIDLDAVD